MSYIDALIENCQMAKAARPLSVIEIENLDLSPLDGIGKGIYMIEEVGGNPEATFSALSLFKSKKERSCPRLNAPSRVMYVGNSTTGVRKRIEQHMGQCHKDTYALHLSYWFEGKCKITVQTYNVTDAVLQIIEDDLSDRLKPAFGKKGGNNK